jgi:hypothetical protein
VLGNKSHGGDAGKFTNQMAQGLNLFRSAAMHRDQDGIYRPFSDDPHGIRNRIPVHRGKTATAGGIHPLAFQRQQDGSDGGGDLL